MSHDSCSKWINEADKDAAFWLVLCLLSNLLRTCQAGLIRLLWSLATTVVACTATEPGEGEGRGNFLEVFIIARVELRAPLLSQPIVCASRRDLEPPLHTTTGSVLTRLSTSSTQGEKRCVLWRLPYLTYRQEIQSYWILLTTTGCPTPYQTTVRRTLREVATRPSGNPTPERRMWSSRYPTSSWHSPSKRRARRRAS